MAIHEFLALLKKSVIFWNFRRTTLADVYPDLREANLSKTNLSGADPLACRADRIETNEVVIGRWAQNEGKIEWRFDGPGPDTVYSGDVVDAAMVGISSTFAGLNGCWYALRSSSTTMTFTARRPGHDEAGNKMSPP
jgi:hypothetical protein